MQKPATFGDYVTAKREHEGYSRKGLARQLGVELTTISRIENGSTPGIDLFLGLVDALHLDLIAAVKLVEPYRRLYQRIIAAQEGRDRHG